MITKEQYIKSLVREMDIIKHLAGKIDASKLDYRPTPGQRSTLELIQYMGRFMTIGIEGNIAGDQNVYIELSKAPNPTTFENFVEQLDAQIKFIQETVGALAEEDFQKESTVFGSTNTLGMHLLGNLKTATAYKMQLFLYIKQSGNDTIGTSNVWGGMDPVVQA